MEIYFPEPSNINVHMMPFIMAREFKDTKLPLNLEPYYDIIVKTMLKREHERSKQLEASFPGLKDEMGKIVYLTVKERFFDS